MQRSTDRMLTTHVGSLIRPDDLLRFSQLTADGGDREPTALEPLNRRNDMRSRSTHWCLGLFVALSVVTFASAQEASEVPTAPEDGGPRNWVVRDLSGGLNLRETPSVRARAVASYRPGTLLDNLGCRRAEARVWCDVQQLGGGPRGYVAAEFIESAVSPDGTVATGPDDSALRAGRGEFDARGQIPCAQSPGQPMTQCDFAVARAGGGYATVVVTKPDGATRPIYFRMGRPIGAGTSQADNPGEFSATREADLSFIRLGAERYEIPDAVVFGG